MDFFDKMGEELASAGKEIYGKTKELTGAAVLHASIASEEFKIKEQYKILGETYYKLYGHQSEEPFMEAVKKIDQSNQKIKEAREELKKRKEEPKNENTDEKKDDVFDSVSFDKQPEEEEEKKE